MGQLHVVLDEASLLTILQFLNRTDLVSCAVISKEWYSLTVGESTHVDSVCNLLWKYRFRNLLQCPMTIIKQFAVELFRDKCIEMGICVEIDHKQPNTDILYETSKVIAATSRSQIVLDFYSLSRNTIAAYINAGPPSKHTPFPPFHSDTRLQMLDASMCSSFGFIIVNFEESEDNHHTTKIDHIFHFGLEEVSISQRSTSLQRNILTYSQSNPDTCAWILVRRPIVDTSLHDVTLEMHLHMWIPNAAPLKSKMIYTTYSAASYRLFGLTSKKSSTDLDSLCESICDVHPRTDWESVIAQGELHRAEDHAGAHN